MRPDFPVSPRIGVIGRNYGAKVLAPAIARAGGVPVELGREWQGEEVDALAIAVPPAAQPDIAIEALRAGVPVFAEKPLAPTFEDAERMNAAALSAGVPAAVDFNFTATRAFRVAKETLPFIGPVRHVSVTWHLQTGAHAAGVTCWKTGRDGWIGNLACHVMFYLDWLLGTILWARMGDHGFSCAWRDFSAICSIHDNAIFGSGHRVEIYGERGKLEIFNADDRHMRLYCRHTNLAGDVFTTGGPVTSEDERIAPTALLLREFFLWIRAGQPMAQSFGAAARLQRLM